jgi:hypothetical protein
MRCTNEEVAMTTTKKSGSKVVRWFRQATQKKTPYRWYEVEHCGM